MTDNEINALCREIAEETLEAEVMAYCDALDEEYAAMMETLYPEYVA
jgi:NurA-like 5'-3' nuclease